MHNFGVCGVGSAEKDAFLCPDHVFLMGILLTDYFNHFCPSFLAATEDPAPSLGAWKGSWR